MGRSALFVAGPGAHHAIVAAVLIAAVQGRVLGLAEMHTSEQLRALLDGRIDAAFIRSPLSDPEQQYTALTLLREPLVAALPASHLLAAATAIALVDLRAEPFILFPRTVGTGLFNDILAACRAAGFDPNIVQEAPQFTSIIGLVSAGLGVSLVPQGLQQLGLDAVAYRPLVGTPVAAPITLVARRRAPSLAVTALLNVARQSLPKPPR